jgi:hypothetical protein
VDLIFEVDFILSMVTFFKYFISLERIGSTSFGIWDLVLCIALIIKDYVKDKGGGSSY